MFVEGTQIVYINFSGGYVRLNYDDVNPLRLSHNPNGRFVDPWGFCGHAEPLATIQLASPI